MWQKIRHRFGLGRPGRGPSKADALNVLRVKGIQINSVIDVGVLDGTPDLMEAFPEVPHLLIEPIDDFNDKIRERYTAAGIAHELVLAAASETAGEMTLHTKATGADITHARLDVPKDVTETKKRTVPARPLDEILAERSLPAPHLLKVDVDGAELNVLKGASTTLNQCGVVCIEASVANLFDRSAPLLEAGFQLFDVVDLCYYDQRLAQMDLIFIRTQLIADLGIELFKDGVDMTKWLPYSS